MRGQSSLSSLAARRIALAVIRLTTWRLYHPRVGLLPFEQSRCALPFRIRIRVSLPFVQSGLIPDRQFRTFRASVQTVHQYRQNIDGNLRGNSCVR